MYIDYKTNLKDPSKEPFFRGVVGVNIDASMSLFSATVLLEGEILVSDFNAICRGDNDRTRFFLGAHWDRAGNLSISIFGGTHFVEMGSTFVDSVTRFVVFEQPFVDSVTHFDVLELPDGKFDILG